MMKARLRRLDFNTRILQLTIDDFAEGGYIISPSLLTKIKMTAVIRPSPAVALRGATGTGKTFLAETLAKITGAYFLKWQASRGADENELFYKILPDSNRKNKSGIKAIPGILHRAATASHHRPVVVLIDEWDKTRDSADAAILTFLQSGEITALGWEIKANLDNLFVIICCNDERTYGEFLVRRLAWIDFKPLPSELVHRALFLSHADHPQLESAVRLYEMTLKAGLDKPATIQELRQLLTCCSFFNNDIDFTWERAVYQFVTKDPVSDRAVRLISQDFKPIPVSDSSQEMEWNFEAFEKDYSEERDDINDVAEFVDEGEKKTKDKRLPFSLPRKINVFNDTPPPLPSNEEFGGILKKDQLRDLLRYVPESVDLTHNSNDLITSKVIDDHILVPPLEFNKESHLLVEEQMQVFFQLDFADSSNPLLFSEISASSARIKELTQTILNMKNCIWKLLSISLKQVVFELFPNNLFSINFQSKSFELQIDTTDESIDYLKVIKSVEIVQNLLLSRIDNSSYFLNELKTEEEREEKRRRQEERKEEETKREEERERKKIEKEERERKKNEEAGQLVLTFVFRNHYKLFKSLFKHIDCSYSDDQEIITHLFQRDDYVELLKSLLKKRHITSNWRMKFVEYFERFGLFRIDDFICVPGDYNFDGTLKLLSSEKADLLDSLRKVIEDRCERIVAIQKEFKYRRYAEEEIVEVLC